MACAVVTNWGNVIKWTTPNQNDISHVEVYRRTDAVTASITTADIVAKIPNVANTEQGFPYFYDLFTAINTTTDYWYWLKSVAFDGQRSDGVAPDVHQTITADRSTLPTLIDTTSDITFEGAITFCSDVTFNTSGAITFAGSAAVSMSNTLHVCGAVTFGDTLVISGALGVNNISHVCGAATFGSTIYACASATFGSTLTVSSNVSINANIAVTGTTTIDGATVINDTLTVSGNATVGGDLAVCGSITVCAHASVGGSIFSWGSLSTFGWGAVGGDFTVGGNLVVSGNTTVCGTSTLQGAVTISGGLTVNTVTVTGDLTMCGTLTVNGTAITNAAELIVDFNASSITTTNLVFNNTDFNVVTGTGTCATVSLAGASGYSIFIEEGAVNKVDTDGQDAKLNFDGSDFDVTIGTGESATVTLASALSLDGGLTINGGVTISGNVTVSGNTSLNGTLIVSGTSTLQGAVTISGGLTVNTLTVTGDLTMCGTLTVNGSAITNADAKVGVDVAATPNYLGATSADGSLRISTGLTIADGGDFITLAVNTATYASISVTAFSTTDKIACSMIDWGDGADQVTSFQMPIGSPTDSDWTDGILSWTNTTNVADALDDLNETLSYLAPDDADSLSGALAYGGTTKYSGRLAQGATNYKAADPAGDLVSYIIFDPDFVLSSGTTATEFNKADEGTTKWYIAVGAAAYGAAVNSVDHTAVFNEASREGSQSATTVAAWSSGALSITYVGWYNSFPKWQIGRAQITCDATDISRGYNRIKMTREDLAVTQESDDWELFYDDGLTTPTCGTPVVTENTPSLRRLSGVRYYDTGSTFDINMNCANNTISYTYYNSGQLYILSSPASVLGTPGWKSYNSAGVQNYGTSPPTNGGVLGITALTTTVPAGSYRTVDARIQVRAYNTQATYDTGTSDSESRLVDTYGTTSTALYEYFDDEDRRISADADFSDKTLTLTGVWLSTKTLVTGDAQLQCGSLTYPTVNYNTGYLPTGQSANYSAFSGDQEYYRGIYDSGGTPHSSGQLELGGLVNADVGSDGTGAVNVFIKLPTQTGWLDLGLAYDSGVFSGADGDGCRTSQSGDDWSWTSGVYSTADSGDRYYIKVVLRNSTRDITQIRELGW